MSSHIRNTDFRPPRFAIKNLPFARSAFETQNTWQRLSICYLHNKTELSKVACPTLTLGIDSRSPQAVSTRHRSGPHGSRKTPRKIKKTFGQIRKSLILFSVGGPRSLPRPLLRDKLYPGAPCCHMDCGSGPSIPHRGGIIRPDCGLLNPINLFAGICKKDVSETQKKRRFGFCDRIQKSCRGDL